MKPQIVVSLEKDPQLKLDPGLALKNTFIVTNTALTVTPIKFMTSGTTAVAVYAKGSHLWVANCGDSRAVMAYRSSGSSTEGEASEEQKSGSILARDLSRDHKPDDPIEQKRIEEWGGFVKPAPEPGLSARVYLDQEFTMIGLAMSRSLGNKN